uniref:Fe2OG dioxygenase domain-containing protein n=2 Tax=Salix viminalis TaxID=40686 RepID=A0A6N2K4R0_SALVM
MGSETSLKLPIIDFSNLGQNPGAAEWDLVKSQVRKALEEYGCFEALFDKIPAEIRKAIFGAVEELFDLPLQTKMLNASKKPYHGYVGQYPQVPLFESMGIDDATIAEEVESMTRILWPQGNQNFRFTPISPLFLIFPLCVSELDHIVRRMIVESLGLEKYLDEHMNSKHLRVMKYKGPETTETKLGLSSHTDKNMVTILYQNQVDGLELQAKDGSWIDLKPTPDSFVVMIGDSLYAWANGRLHSPYHRVMMRGNAARYSVGLFSVPKAGYIIKAPEEMIDEEHPCFIDHVQFLGFYYTEAGQRAPSALKSYCGAAEWDLVKSQVRKALEEYGCFEALFDKIPAEIRKAIFGAVEELFDLPLQTKMLNASKKPYHGYVGQYPQVPLFESMGIDDATIAEEVSELDHIVRRMIVESLGLEKYLDEHMNSTNHLLRVMKYKGPETTETKLGLSSHTDKNMVTILYQNQVDGLELQAKDGSWIDLKPTPDSFVVMIGDSLYAWANGRLHSPYHRVMMRGNAARYSVGLFSVPKAGYIIKAPEEMIDEEHPLLFKPFDHVQFLGFYYTEAGQRAPSALKSYCGV